MSEFIASGRTVEEAIEAALQMAGLSREEAEVEILDEGSRGIFGLGMREARVRVTPKTRPTSSRVDLASEIARALIDRMGFEATVRARDTERGVAIEVEGEDLAALIGRHGQALAAFETILGLLVARAAGEHVPLEVDVAGYRERRRAELVARARRAAQRAVREGRAIHLPPMDARDRRLVHTALAEDPAVTTRSEGEGANRHVVITPKAGTGRRRRPPRPDDR